MTVEWVDPRHTAEERAERAHETAQGALPRVASGLLPVGAGLAGFGVYLATLAPTVSILDSPELSAAAITLGVPHPTGYPLFMLLGHAWQALVGVVAGGDPAWRLNLLTAVFAGIAVAAIASAGRRLAGRASAGWLAAGVFGFSPAFWAQANVVEVYALHVAFSAGILALWLRVEDAAEHDCDVRVPLRWLAFTVGLSLTHHLMAVLVLPAVAVSLVARWRDWWSPRELLVLAALALAPLALYAYLPVVASGDPLVNWGNPETLEAFWYHVSGGQYHQNVEAPSQPLLATARGYAAQLAHQLGLALLPLAALGCWQADAGRLVRLGLGLGFAAALAFGLSYGVVDSEPFQLNAYLVVALWMGCGAARAVREAARRAPAAGLAVEALVWAAPLWALVAGFPAQDRQADFSAHDQAVAALALLPENAVLVTQGPAGYPPVYAQLVEGLRPDVAVVDTYLHLRGSYGPELDRLRQSRLPAHVTRELALLETVASLDGGRRSLWLMPGVPDFPFETLGLQRVRGGVVDPLLRGVPDLRAPAPAGAAIGFQRGFSLRGLRPDRDSVESGGALRIDAWWQLGDIGSLASDAPTVTFVLADAEGTAPTGRDGLPLFEQKRPLGGGVPLAAYAAGDVVREAAALVVPRGIEPGTWWLWVSIRDGEQWLELPDGRLFARTAQVEVTPRRRPLWTLPQAD